MTDTISCTPDQFTAADGLRLARLVWRPPDEARAAVAVVHGYGEHGGRYAQLAEELAATGLTVSAYDLRGHGRSAGRRGHVRRFVEYLDDTALFLDGARREAAGRPLFLLGHSMGGLIAASYAEQRPVDDLTGLVLSAPFLRLAIPVTGAKLFAARVASFVVPTLDVGNSLDASGLSHDGEVVDAYRTDPLNHSVATARWATEMLAAQRHALSAAGSIRLPLLVMVGDDDAVADPAAGRELFAAASSADKTLRRYPGYFHEIFNETGRDVPVADLTAWLQERVPGA
jgi:lysophospholipase